MEDQRGTKYSRCGRSQDIIDQVRASVVERFKLSIDQGLQQVGLSETTTCI